MIEGVFFVVGQLYVSGWNVNLVCWFCGGVGYFGFGGLVWFQQCYVYFVWCQVQQFNCYCCVVKVVVDNYDMWFCIYCCFFLVCCFMVVFWVISWC